MYEFTSQPRGGGSSGKIIVHDPDIEPGEHFFQQEFYPGVFEAELEIPEVDVLSTPGRAVDEIGEKMSDIEQQILKRYPQAEDVMDGLPDAAYNDPFIEKAHNELTRLGRMLDQTKPEKKAGGGGIKKYMGTGKKFEAELAKSRGEPVAETEFVPGKPDELNPGISHNDVLMATHMIEEYTERSVHNVQLKKDPGNPNLYAVRSIDSGSDEVMDWLWDISAEDSMDALEEVEFTQWPPTINKSPSPLGNYAGGGLVKKAVSKSRALAALKNAREMLEDSDPDIDSIARLMMKDTDLAPLGRRILANEAKVADMDIDDAQQYYQRIQRLLDEAEAKLGEPGRRYRAAEREREAKRAKRHE